MRNLWTPEQDNYLSEQWGIKSIKKLCEVTGRSECALRNRAIELNLGPYLDAGGYVTVNQMAQVLIGRDLDTATAKKWERYDFPTRMKRVKKGKFKVVYLNDFWKWADTHRDVIDFSRMEPLALGKEPDWVAERRATDFRSKATHRRKDAWTKHEAEVIAHMTEGGKTVDEIAEHLGRSPFGIRNQMTAMGIAPKKKQRKNRPWTEEDNRIMGDMIRKGASDLEIGKALGRSSEAVKARYFTTYRTRNKPEVLRLMGDGPFGTNAPEWTVGEILTYARFKVPKRKAREDLTRVATALTRRMAQLSEANGYTEYFQRQSCRHWREDSRSCPYGGDCDSCINFKRKEEQ